MSPSLSAHEIHEVAPLDSSSSIGTASSPTLLIPESLPHGVHLSLGPSHGTLTVRFAPLPQIDPNRKRSLAPIGASARSRRKRAVQQEGGSLLWSTDPDVQEEDLEDPVVAFAKLIKRTGKTLWRKVRQGSKAVSQEDVPHSTAEPVLDISSTGDAGLGDKGKLASEVMGGEDKRERPASWSPESAERRTLSLDKATRRSTSDLSSRHPVVS